MLLIDINISVLIVSLAFLIASIASIIFLFAFLCYQYFTQVPITEDAPMKSIEHVADLQPDDWGNLIRLNGILRAWKGEYSGGKLSIDQAPKAALVLLKDSGPEFEVFDDGFTEIQESSSRIQRDMALKGFTESGIHAALAGGAHGLTLGLGGGISWHNDETALSNETAENTTIHGFYNFPRAIIYLDPGSFKLSDACIHFMEEHKSNSDTKKVLEKFFQRFGGLIATKVTLGARLCTREEVKNDQESATAAVKKEMRSQLEATVMTPAGGFSMGGNRSRGSESKDQKNLSEKGQRMLIETQGGDSFLASNIQDWKASVRSHKNWRVIQQSSPKELLLFLEDALKRRQPGADSTSISVSEDCYDTIKKLNEYTVNERERLEQESHKTLNLVAAADVAPFSSHTVFHGFISPSRPGIIASITANFVAETQPVLYGDALDLSPDQIARQNLLSNPETYIFKGKNSRIYKEWSRTFPFQAGKGRTCTVSLQIILKPGWSWIEGNSQNADTMHLSIPFDKTRQEIISLRVQWQPPKSPA